MAHHIELSVEGETGSGKTTVALVIARALRAEGFDVVVEGADADQVASDARVWAVATAHSLTARSIRIREVRARRSPEISGGENGQPASDHTALLHANASSAPA